jgi:Tol biopolymer transport system component
MLQDSRGGSAVRLSRPTTAWQRWSPDASQILVRSFEDFPDIQLELVPRLGGPARVVARDVMRGTASWSPDGTLIATPAGKGFLLINVATGAATSVTVDDVRSVENVHDWSGATDLLLVGMFTNRGGWALYCARRDGSQIRRILSDKGISAAYWSPAGDAVYYSHTTDKDVGEVVWVPVDPGTGTVLGTPSVVVGGLEPGTAFAMSGDASRIALERSQLFTNLLLRDLHADELKAASQDKKLTQSSLRNGNPAVSPDGKWIVFTAGQFRSWKRNLYKMPIGGGPATQLTSLDSGAYGPAWSPDGKRIAFTGDKTGGRAVWVVNADGGEPRMLADSDMEGGQGYPLTWAPGNRILFTARGGKTFAIDPDAGGKQALPKDDEFFTQGQPFYSPDGARVAVRGNGGVWVVSAADGVGELRIKEDLSLLGWHPDGRSLIVLTRDRQILNVPLMGGARRQLTALPREVTDIAMSPDGQRLVYAVDQYWSDIWLLENLNPGRQRK